MSAHPSQSGFPGAEGWSIDIEALVPRMNAIHPKLDHGVSLDELNSAAHDLAAHVSSLTDDELLDGVQRIVAMVSREGCDGHTGAYVWGTGEYPLHSMPLRLYWFDDGVYVIDALDPYTGLIGSKVTSIADTPTDDVTARMAPLVPRDNEFTVRLLMPRYLLLPEALSGVGVATGPTVALVTIATDGKPKTTQVESVPIDEYNAAFGFYGLLLPPDPAVMYLSRMDDKLWWESLDESTLYVQYNEVAFALPDELHDLREAIAAPGIKRIVFDLRHNTGGEVHAIDAFTDMFTDPDVTHPGDHLYVITSRNTFSAASMLVARLKDRPGATIVGEPMSGCPTTWGNSRKFKLPFSKIEVAVATQLEVGVTEDDTRSTIEPDIAAPLTELDWAAGRDPALAAIQALP